MEAQPSFKRAECRVELDPEPAINSYFSGVVDPRNPKDDLPFGLAQPVQDGGVGKFGVFNKHMSQRLEHFANRLLELGFARASADNLVEDGLNALVESGHAVPFLVDGALSLASPGTRQVLINVRKPQFRYADAMAMVLRDFTRADRALMANDRFSRQYHQSVAHDQRAHAYFVVGKKMSGIFCSPRCHSRMPRPSHCEFFVTAAAAHAAGYVPCPRCQPDDGGWSPELHWGHGLGERAVRLIADGELDRNGVTGLAECLRITPRHLLREVRQVTGTGPLRVARAVRMHTARLLVRATTLPMADIALASGFASVRQYDATVAQFYGVTAGSLRRGSGDLTRGRRQPGPITVRCALPVRHPFDMTSLVSFLAAYGIPEVEQSGHTWFARTVRLPHAPGHMRLDTDGRGGVIARLTVSDLRDFIPLYARARVLIDADADARRVDAELARDPALSASVARHRGVRVPGAVDIAETVLRNVIALGVSRETARTMLGGLANELGEATNWGMLFPTAGAIARNAPSVLRAPPERMRTITAVARDISSGRLPLHIGWSRNRLAARLTGYPGIGQKDALLIADRATGGLGSRGGEESDVLAGARSLGMPSDAARLARVAAAWQPWRPYGFMHVCLAAE